MTTNIKLRGQEIADRYLNGESQGHIAADMGVSRDAVRWLLKCGHVAGRRSLHQRIGFASMDERELAYIAGLFDGEGCICIFHRKRPLRSGLNAYQLCVSVNLTHRPTVARLQSLFGGSLINKVYQNPKWKKAWTWGIGGIRAGAFLAVLEPYLTIKKAEANAGILFAETVTWANRARYVSPEAQHLRELCYLSAKQLKAAS